MCGGENLDFPKVFEEKDRTVIIYSCKNIKECEKDEGVEICYSKEGEVVKIIIPKDENHYLINL